MRRIRVNETTRIKVCGTDYIALKRLPRKGDLCVMELRDHIRDGVQCFETLLKVVRLLGDKSGVRPTETEILESEDDRYEVGTLYWGATTKGLIVVKLVQVDKPLP